MSPKEPTGNCFVVALQMVYDYSTPEDIFPVIIPKHGHDLTDFDFTTLRLVHGSGIINGVRKNHAWVELGDHVIDYSNGNKTMSLKDLYYDPHGNNLKISISLAREQVLLLLQQKNESFYWGDYTKGELDQRRKAYTSSISLEQTWVPRDFLEGLEIYQRQSHE
jgi:hypothetical protein